MCGAPPLPLGARPADNVGPYGELPTPAGNPLIEIRNLWHRYGAADRPALDGISFAVEKRDRLAIVGRSGSGKTTLLSVLGGLLPPGRGRIRYHFDDGTVQAPISAGRRGRHIGIVFQQFHLIPTLTAVENVELPLFGHVAGRHRRRERALELVRAAGLTEFAERLPTRLSGGEQQRVAICRALVNRPTLLLADEPTGNLDPQTAGEILDLIHNMAEESGSTVIVVTHDDRAARRLDRILRMEAGRLVDEREAAT